MFGADADNFLNFGSHALRFGRGQIDLVDDRQHLEPLLDGGVAVGDALCLDALRGINHQQRTFTGRQAAGHLIGKIHVARGIDEVELIALAAWRVVIERRALRLDGNAALALQFHGIEHLRLHLALLQATTELNQAVGERRFTVINMGDDREISYELHQVGNPGPQGPGRADYSRKSRSNSARSSLK